MDSNKDVKTWLSPLPYDEELKELLCGLLDICRIVGATLAGTQVETVGSRNDFGDEQLSVDMIAEKILCDWAKQTATIRAISSEENPHMTELHDQGKYILCWDPLDGSSIIDCNWAVGTIVGIWKVDESTGVAWKGTETLTGATGRQQVASVMVVYGPRTTCLLNIGDHTQDVLIPHTGSIKCLKTPKIEASGAKIFSPANLRSSQDLPAYRRLVDYWMKERYTLRYTGGLVPDVYQMFIKGKGIFCNPTSSKSPAKLRLVYEVAPIAKLIESCGGRTSNGTQSLLDVPIQGLDHRTCFCGGTEEEVARFEQEMSRE